MGLLKHHDAKKLDAAVIIKDNRLQSDIMSEIRRFPIKKPTEREGVIKFNKKFGSFA